MKFMFLLMALFVLACMLYGIFAGVAAIARGIARVGGGQYHAGESPIQPLPAKMAAPAGLHRDYVAELQTLFSLHHSGALTAEEFGRLKQRLFAEMN
jgi:hypothetical protein